MGLNPRRPKGILCLKIRMLGLVVGEVLVRFRPSPPNASSFRWSVWKERVLDFQQKFQQNDRYGTFLLMQLYVSNPLLTL